ncbi:hypothetical protein NXC14_PA00343 (plasmid) [Rhizobium sp. NXC14]|nr:hypothetical protein NXC14_PA00343 [Rhizobium sp. NXC14]
MRTNLLDLTRYDKFADGVIGSVSASADFGHFSAFDLGRPLQTLCLGLSIAGMRFAGGELSVC